MRGQDCVHGIRLPLDDLLVVRAFELWVHDNDIRRAVVADAVGFCRLAAATTLALD